jgi:hypothetical protein
LLRPQNRGPVLAAAIVLVAIAGFAIAWQRWGEPTIKSPDYLLTPDRLVVTPQPKWIHADVKAEVIRSSDLSSRNVRDPKLAEEIAAAFALHPWVAMVVRVEKHFPARVDVTLEYRRPVAAVEIANRGEAGLLFVDGLGVLLPSTDFAQSQAKGFLRIAAGDETPAGGYGVAWGSERVSGAASIAAAFGQKWQPLGLYRVVAVETTAGDLTYELRTKSEARVVWGAAPGQEALGEPSPEQKIAALEHLVSDKGPLDRAGAPPLVDLRKSAP